MGKNKEIIMVRKPLKGYIAYDMRNERADPRTFATNRQLTIERAGCNTPGDWRWLRKQGWRTVKVTMAYNWS